MPSTGTVVWSDISPSPAESVPLYVSLLPRVMHVPGKLIALYFPFFGAKFLCSAVFVRLFPLRVLFTWFWILCFFFYWPAILWYSFRRRFQLYYDHGGAYAEWYSFRTQRILWVRCRNGFYRWPFPSPARVPHVTRGWAVLPLFFNLGRGRVCSLLGPRYVSWCHRHHRRRGIAGSCCVWTPWEVGLGLPVRPRGRTLQRGVLWTIWARRGLPRVLACLHFWFFQLAISLGYFSCSRPFHG